MVKEKRPENINESVVKAIGGGIAPASSKRSHFENVSWVDTGSYTLNKLINKQGKGLPAANMVEIYGDSTSGKSVTGLHVVKSALAQDGIVVYFDTEGSFNPELAENSGIDLDRLLLVDPTTEESGELTQLTATSIMSRGEKLIREVRRQFGPDKLLTLVWDSLGGTAWEEDLEGDEPSLTQGSPQRKLTRWMKRVMPLVTSTNTLWLVINQVFGQPGTFTQDESQGGKAIKFHSEIRIRCVLKGKTKGRLLDDNGFPIGARLHYEIVKNRVGPPWMEGYSEFYFGENGNPYIDYYSGYADYLVKRKAIESGKGKLIVGEDIYQKRTVDKEFIQCSYMEKMLEEHPELLLV